MLAFVLGIIVGLLIGWWIWGRGAARPAASTGQGPSSAPSRLDRPSDASASAVPTARSTTMATPVAGAVLASGRRDEAEASRKDEPTGDTHATPHLDTGDAIAPTGVPDVGGSDGGERDGPVKGPAKDPANAPVMGAPTISDRGEADASSDPDASEPLPSGGVAPSGTVYVADGTPDGDEAGTLTPAALAGAADGPAVETASLEPAAPVATGPLIDEAARERARAIGIAPAELGRHGDDLKRIRGIGPKLEEMLHELGVYTFAQMAAWSEAEIDAVDGNLTAFKGRIRRDDWHAQAAELQEGRDGADPDAQAG